MSPDYIENQTFSKIDNLGGLYKFAAILGQFMDYDFIASQIYQIFNNQYSIHTDRIKFLQTAINNRKDDMNRYFNYCKIIDTQPAYLNTMLSNLVEEYTGEGLDIDNGSKEVEEVESTNSEETDNVDTIEDSEDVDSKDSEESINVENKETLNESNLQEENIMQMLEKHLLELVNNTKQILDVVTDINEKIDKNSKHKDSGNKDGGDSEDDGDSDDLSDSNVEEFSKITEELNDVIKPITNLCSMSDIITTNRNGSFIEPVFRRRTCYNS